MAVGEAVHGELRPRQILAQRVVHTVRERLLQGFSALDLPGALGALAHGGFNKDRIARHRVGALIKAGQIVRAREVGIGLVLVPADCHRLLRRGDDRGVQPLPRLAQGQEGAVVGGKDIVHAVVVDDAVHEVHQRRIVRKGKALHAIFEHELGVAGDAGAADEANKLAAAQGRVDLKGDLGPGREHEHRFLIGHLRPPYANTF